MAKIKMFSSEGSRGNLFPVSSSILKLAPYIGSLSLPSSKPTPGSEVPLTWPHNNLCLLPPPYFLHPFFWNTCSFSICSPLMCLLPFYAPLFPRVHRGGPFEKSDFCPKNLPVHAHRRFQNWDWGREPKVSSLARHGGTCL